MLWTSPKVRSTRPVRPGAASQRKFAGALVGCLLSSSPALAQGWLGIPGFSTEADSGVALPGPQEEPAEGLLLGQTGADQGSGSLFLGGDRLGRDGEAAGSGDAVGWFDGVRTPRGIRFAGLLRTLVRHGSGDPFGVSAGPAAEIPDGFVWAVTRVGQVDLRVEIKASTLADADEQIGLGQVVADVWLDERHTLSIGRATVPFSSSAYLREDRLVFPERSKWAQSFDLDDEGVVGRGRYGFMDLWVGVQNSPDGLGTSFRATGRADFWLNGTQNRPTELLYRAPMDEVARLSLAYTDDGEFDEADSYGLEFEWRSRDWRFMLEYADNAADVGDNRPFSLTAHHAVVRNELEVAVRYEDRDDSFGTKSISVGSTRYLLRDFVLAQLAVDYVTADVSEQEGWTVRAGFVLGF